MLKPRWFLPLILAAACSKSEPLDVAADAPAVKKQPTKVVVGGLYAVDNGDDTYSVVKVLAADPLTVHLRRYGNVFDEVSDTIDPATLEVGVLGMEHDQVGREAFVETDPLFLRKAQEETTLKR